MPLRSWQAQSEPSQVFKFELISSLTGSFRGTTTSTTTTRTSRISPWTRCTKRQVGSSSAGLAQKSVVLLHFII